MSEKNKEKLKIINQNLRIMVLRTLRCVEKMREISLGKMTNQFWLSTEVKFDLMVDFNIYGMFIDIPVVAEVDYYQI